MEELLKTLDPHLALISYYFDDNNLVINATRTAATSNWPYCGSKSTKIHSNYVRVIHDLPVQNFVLKIILTRKIFFCDDPECEHRTFAEPLGFLKRYAKDGRTRVVPFEWNGRDSERMVQLPFNWSI